jgi:hypothetical protein
MARKFFVGGNFKMYVGAALPRHDLQNPALELRRADRTTATCRNGTKESIKSIVKGLNEAQLDSNVG